MENAFSETSNLSNNVECSSSEIMPIENSVKLETRSIHIPYILNGELYEIQTQEGENVTVKCCHCPPDRVYRGSVRSTGNFHMHIKRRHPDLLGKLHDMKVTALLERRDRFMKNRKANQRSQRNVNLQIKKEQEAVDMDSEVALQYTHKLKIKTAFQRHQMQQEQLLHQQHQQATQNWSVTPFVVVPIASTNEDMPKPLNLSLDNRSLDKFEETDCPPTKKVSTLVIEQKKLNSIYNTPMNSSQIETVTQNKSQIVGQSQTENIGTSSPTLSTISTVTTSDNLRSCNYIKKELLSTSEAAMDLTTQSASFASSGIGLCCDDGRVALSADANTSSINSNIKCDGIIQNVRNTLSEILNEIRLRNQLDIAKFKYLHPNFHFHI